MASHGRQRKGALRFPGRPKVAGGTTGTYPHLITAALPDSVDLLELARAQGTCTGLALLHTNSSLLLEDIPVSHLTVCCDTSGSQQRLLVPPSPIHSLVHPGIRATRRLVAACFVWRGMATDVGRWCRVQHLPESEDHYPAICTCPKYPSSSPQIHPHAC